MRPKFQIPNPKLQRAEGRSGRVWNLGFRAYPWSLVPQRLDRIEPRGLARGIKSEKNSHHRAEDESDEHCVRRDECWPLGQGGQQFSCATAKCNADQAAQSA